MTIYEKVIDLCTLHQIDKTSLESACGFSQNSINKWKNSSPSIDKLIKVADYFEVTLDELVGRKTVLTWKQFLLKCAERKISIGDLQNELTIKHPNGSIECLLSDALLSKWENGIMPDEETLFAVQDYFAHSHPILELSQPQLDLLSVFAEYSHDDQIRIIEQLRCQVKLTKGVDVFGLFSPKETTVATTTTSKK